MSRRRRRFWRLPRAAVLRILFLTPEEPRLPDAEWNHICAAVRNRDGNVCQLRRLWGWGPKCGRPAECVDHIRPVSLGGSSDPSNCRAACMRCNTRKRHRPPLGWAIGRVIRAWGTVGVVAYFAVMSARALPEPPAEASANAARAYAAVVSPEHAARLQPGDVGTYADRSEAERAAATWAGMGAGGTWYVVEIPVSR